MQLVVDMTCRRQAGFRQTAMAQFLLLNLAEREETRKNSASIHRYSARRLTGTHIPELDRPINTTC